MSESSGSSDDRTEYDKISDTLFLAGLIRLDLAHAPQEIRDLVSSLDTLPEENFVFSSSKATLEDLRHALDRYHNANDVEASSNADIHKAALRYASSIPLNHINVCEAQSDGLWHCFVGRLMMEAFFESAVSSNSASMSCYSQWKDGSLTSRLAGAYPESTTAFGVGMAPSHSQGELEATSLHALEIIARRFDISYSPTGKHFVFPGIVCELKSDETPLFQVEAQATCNAMRALNLLEDLRVASMVSCKDPTVVVVAASGPHWRFSVAQSRIKKGLMVTEIYPMDLVPLDIRAPAQRLRTLVILGQLQKWVSEKHRDWVSQHLKILWQQCQVEYEDVEGGLEPPETEDVDHWEGVFRQTGGWD